MFTVYCITVESKIAEAPRLNNEWGNTARLLGGLDRQTGAGLSVFGIRVDLDRLRPSENL